ncbi:S9 family peptidase [Puteibacter caeruleilacunae]|nr:S9 family peptidase [Puteibacter caeruleilacunae]
MKKVFTLALCLLMTGALFAQQGTKEFKITDFTRDYTFSQSSVYGLRSMNDGVHYTTNTGGTKVEKYSYKTGKAVSTVLDLSKIEDCPISRFSQYTFSNDETKILLETAKRSIYRHSYTAEYYVWNSLNETITPLSENGRQQLATFSPDGTRVAFVRDNNLFIKNLKFGTEHQVTHDGEYNKIINGAPDWVYEEEFSFNKAFAWSPDSKMLAFFKFDESEVPLFGMTRFQATYPSMDQNALYPENYTFKYPKAGEKNSTVSIHVYSLKYKKSVKMDVGEETDQYIPRIKWANTPDILTIMRLNRHQNKLEFIFANPLSGTGKVVYTEENERYISEGNFDNLIFLNDNKHFIFTSEKDGYSHIYLYDMNGKEVKQITEGEFDVTKFYGYDQKYKTFYYQAAAKNAMQREVYKKSIDGKINSKLSTLEGTNNAVFSKNFQYYINYFNNVSTPNLVTLHDKKGRQIRVLEDNQRLKDKLKEYGYNTKEFFTFKTSNGDELNGWMIKPVNFDENKQYPVLMTQYSGPNSQQVVDRFGISWNDYLSQQGYLVVCVDGRGTGARGEDFRKVTYMQLGKYESDDQIEAAKYLQSLPYVSKDNIAIWGWSFGGFMVNLCMEKGNGIFKAGLSIAPVTNWRYYDSIYTERYMRTPQENSEGYDDNSPLTHADKLKGNLLIIHGSADDNVHVQNTMEFTDRLVQAGIPFDMAIYTNRNHSIYGGNTRTHLYQKFTNFLNQHLKSGQQNNLNGVTADKNKKAKESTVH